MEDLDLDFLVEGWVSVAWALARAPKEMEPAGFSKSSSSSESESDEEPDFKF